MTKAPGAARGGVEGSGFVPADLFVAGNDELGDAFVALDQKRLRPVVDEKDFELTAVVGINGAGSVEDGDAVVEGESAAGTDLRFEAGRQCDAQAGGNKRALTGIKKERIVYGDGRAQIHAGTLRGGVGWQFDVVGMRQAFEGNGRGRCGVL